MGRPRTERSDIRHDANRRESQKENVPGVNEGHSSVGLYPISDFIRVDSCDVRCRFARYVGQLN
jgi:hypothetical protein